MQHSLPELPFARNALAPYMSEETLNFHYGKHHQTYVNTLNKLIADSPYANSSLEDIVKQAEGPIFNNAAQHWNHSFFWNCLAPNAGGEPRGAIAAAIKDQFESFAKFRERFSSIGLATFGSGWVWLVKENNGKLAIESTSNAVNPLRQNRKAILTCDVWEHAYYIDYRNERAKFLEAFWNVVNWNFVEKNFI
jgi:Fe-Mn family superoxide dismutase